MNARELHDSYAEKGIMLWMGDPSAQQIILRALDLLARVGESEDELVRELRGLSLLLAYRYLYEEEKTVDRAAAALVALKAERDALKAHAEAMANGVEGKVYYADAPDVCEAVDAYRRDFPKDAP